MNVSGDIVIVGATDRLYAFRLAAGVWAHVATKQVGDVSASASALGADNITLVPSISCERVCDAHSDPPPPPHTHILLPHTPSHPTMSAAAGYRDARHNSPGMETRWQCTNSWHTHWWRRPVRCVPAPRQVSSSGKSVTGCTSKQHAYTAPAVCMPCVCIQEEWRRTHPPYTCVSMACMLQCLHTQAPWQVGTELCEQHYRHCQIADQWCMHCCIIQ